MGIRTCKKNYGTTFLQSTKPFSTSRLTKYRMKRGQGVFQRPQPRVSTLTPVNIRRKTLGRNLRLVKPLHPRRRAPEEKPNGEGHTLVLKYPVLFPLTPGSIKKSSQRVFHLGDGVRTSNPSSFLRTESQREQILNRSRCYSTTPFLLFTTIQDEEWISTDPRSSSPSRDTRGDAEKLHPKDVSTRFPLPRENEFYVSTRRIATKPVTTWYIYYRIRATTRVF